MNPEIKVSPVFLANYNALKAGHRIIANQGGTRSGKTYSIMQLLALYAQENQGTQISVTSIALPHLKKGARKDFIEVLDDNGWYNESNINKTDQIYYFGTSHVEFFSCDSPLKVRGPGRDILFINEANLIQFETFRQLLLRTRKTLILDYNPADEFHWIYDHVLNRDDCKFIKSTYLDNYDFLPIEQIQEIERLKEEDENYWRVYGLGERGTSTATIYPNWQVYNGEISVDDDFYGLDFGYNVPSCLMRVGIKEMKNVYWEEKIYESHLTNSQLIQRMGDIGIDKKKQIWADNAEPDRIEEIQRAGYNIKPANKSVKDGIDKVKSLNLFIHGNSINAQKEARSYKWKQDSSGNIIADEPVKFNDHAMDAGRYGTYNYLLQANVPKPSNKITVHQPFKSYYNGRR